MKKHPSISPRLISNGDDKPKANSESIPQNSLNERNTIVANPMMCNV